MAQNLGKRLITVFMPGMSVGIERTVYKNSKGMLFVLKYTKRYPVLDEGDQVLVIRSRDPGRGLPAQYLFPDGEWRKIE